jgi:hypothetical protein
MKVMTNPDFDQHSIYDEQTLSFSFKKKSVQKVLGSVLAIHLIIFFISLLGFPDFKITKRPDITIEIGAAPPASNAPSQSSKTYICTNSKRSSKGKNTAPFKR